MSPFPGDCSSIDEAKQRFTPAEALTAHVKAATREHALATGFQAWLSKPVEPAQLAHTIAGLLQPSIR